MYRVGITPEILNVKTICMGDLADGLCTNNGNREGGNCTAGIMKIMKIVKKECAMRESI